VDNEHAADQICEIVSELTRDPQTRLHASVAGGRKTMSLYLTAAMQLFARSWDRMSHVLVSRDFETLNDFYYIPPTPCEIEVRDRQTGEVKRISTARAEIHLADIPFIRLRGVLAGWLGDDRPTYGEMVKRTQSDLDSMETMHDLKLDLRARTLRVADWEAKLAEREFFIYLLFAWLRQTSQPDEGVRESAWRAAHEIRRSIGMTSEKLSPKRARINRKLEEAGFPSRFFLASQGERGSVRYGLALAPEQIGWN